VNAIRTADVRGLAVSLCYDAGSRVCTSAVRAECGPGAASLAGPYHLILDFNILRHLMTTRLLHAAPARPTRQARTRAAGLVARMMPRRRVSAPPVPARFPA